MFTEKLSQEQAQNEFNGWLDIKKVAPSKRELQSESIKLIVEHLMYGTLVINDDKTITHTLLFPIMTDTGEVFKDKLTYKSRLRNFDITQKLKGVKPGDVDGRFLAYKSALSGEAVGVLQKLDTSDDQIADAIMYFFS